MLLVKPKLNQRKCSVQMSNGINSWQTIPNSLADSRQQGKRSRRDDDCTLRTPASCLYVYVTPAQPIAPCHLPLPVVVMPKSNETRTQDMTDFSFSTSSFFLG